MARFLLSGAGRRERLAKRASGGVEGISFKKETQITSRTASGTGPRIFGSFVVSKDESKERSLSEGIGRQKTGSPLLNLHEIDVAGLAVEVKM
jgi:hypothetical protein